MDRETATRRATEIVHLLNERIDRANQDPRLMENRSEGKWYRPIRRTTFPAEYDRWEVPRFDKFDDFSKYTYEWPATFEYGISQSSSGFIIKYFPAPLEYLKGFGSYSDKYKDEWKQLNSVIDLSIETFLYCGKPQNLISNNFEDVLHFLDALIELIVDSRKRAK